MLTQHQPWKAAARPLWSIGSKRWKKDNAPEETRGGKKSPFRDTSMTSMRRDCLRKRVSRVTGVGRGVVLFSCLTVSCFAALIFAPMISVSKDNVDEWFYVGGALSGNSQTSGEYFFGSEWEMGDGKIYYGMMKCPTPLGIMFQTTDGWNVLWQFWFFQQCKTSKLVMCHIHFAALELNT